MNRKLHSSHSRTYIITLTTQDPSETWRISNFHCCCFLDSLSCSSTGFGSYL